MRLKFTICKLQIILRKSSKPSNHIPSRGLNTHSQKIQDYFDDNIINLISPKIITHLQHFEDIEIPFILNKIVSFCANLTLFHLGIQLHSVITKMGFDPNVYIATVVIDMYGKCGVVSSAQKLFDEMPLKNVVTWNTLMSAYLHNGYPRIAIELFLEMLERDIWPEPTSISNILVSCAYLEDVGFGPQIHGFCLKTGFFSNVVVGTGLIDVYVKCVDIDSSRRVFDEMLEKNVVTWTAIVTGYAINQRPYEAMVLVRDMMRWGIRPTYITYTVLLRSLLYPDDLDCCKQIQCRIIREGLESNSYLAVTLATVYSECSCSLNDFHKLYACIKIWDQISWSAVITGFSNLEEGENALNCFSRMRQAGVTPDFFTFTSILRAIGIISALEVGTQVHSLVIKSGYAPNVFVQNGLISMYARGGKINDSQKVFTEMDKRDLISWNSLLSGLAHNGFGKEAVDLFEQMRKTKFKPDLSTFLAVLSGCSHAGLLEKGLEYFDLMESAYSLKSTIDHYTCVVDLYGRAALLKEAEDFINEMPVKPGPSVLKALLSACQIHGNTEIAVRLAKKLAGLYPNDPTTYVMLSNVFANGGNWSDVALVRKVMSDRGVRKHQPSSSRICIDVADIYDSTFIP